MSRQLLVIIAVIVIAGAVLLFSNHNSPISSKVMGIPENYYFKLQPADIDSPVELIRFATSIRPYTIDFTIPERLAFFEWYLKNRGFNVSYAYSNNFRNSGKEHIWLILKNKLGETMAIEPSHIEMQAESISPTTPDYKRYQKEFADINELSTNTGGSDQYAWWRKSSGQNLFNENVMLLKKRQL